MLKQTRMLAEAAAKLPAAERVALVDEIATTFVDNEDEWASAWSAEAARRMEAFQRGEISALDSDAVFDALDAKFA